MLRLNRGGTDNSLTRIVMKPTHFIRGYARLSFGFNYYGPTGSQRDEVAISDRQSTQRRPRQSELHHPGDGLLAVSGR